jgi:hypothetical protein
VIGSAEVLGALRAHGTIAWFQISVNFTASSVVARSRSGAQSEA